MCFFHFLFDIVSPILHPRCDYISIFIILLILNLSIKISDIPVNHPMKSRMEVAHQKMHRVD